MFLCHFVQPADKYHDTHPISLHSFSASLPLLLLGFVGVFDSRQRFAATDRSWVELLEIDKGTSLGFEFVLISCLEIMHSFISKSYDVGFSVMKLTPNRTHHENTVNKRAK